MSGPIAGIAHELKVLRMYFDALSGGRKTFEFRVDDRIPAFQIGDVLRLREWGGRQMDYSGRECYRRVTYVARGLVIPDGFACMSVEPTDEVAYRLAAENAVSTTAGCRSPNGENDGA